MTEQRPAMSTVDPSGAKAALSPRPSGSGIVTPATTAQGSRAADAASSGASGKAAVSLVHTATAPFRWAASGLYTATAAVGTGTASVVSSAAGAVGGAASSVGRGVYETVSGVHSNAAAGAAWVAQAARNASDEFHGTTEESRANAVAALAKKGCLVALSGPGAYVTVWLCADAGREVLLALLPPPTLSTPADRSSTLAGSATRVGDQAEPALYSRLAAPWRKPYAEVYYAISSIPRAARHAAFILPACVFLGMLVVQRPVRVASLSWPGATVVEVARATGEALGPGLLSVAGLHCLFLGAELAERRGEGAAPTAGQQRTEWGVKEEGRRLGMMEQKSGGSLIQAGLSLSALALWTIGTRPLLQGLLTPAEDKLVALDITRSVVAWLPDVAPAMDVALTWAGIPTMGLVGKAATKLNDAMEKAAPRAEPFQQLWAYAPALATGLGVAVGIVTLLQWRKTGQQQQPARE